MLKSVELAIPSWRASANMSARKIATDELEWKVSK